MIQRYWLLKSEPSTWSWEEQLQVTSEPWTGVRNYQARNFMKEMNVGDLAFFYHSNTGKEIVGIVKIVAPYHPDATDDSGKFGCVDVSSFFSFKVPVTLNQIKKIPDLQDMALLRQSRLSVMTLTKKEWDLICKMGGYNALL